MERVVRDSSWIHREYGQEKWPAVLEQIDSSHSDAEKLVHTLAMGDSMPKPVWLGSSVVDLPHRLAMAGYLGWVAGCVADYSKSSDLIIELGAGWGRNLLLAWLHGANPHAHYVAAEFTAAGRQASMQLASRARGINMSAIDFDYKRPTLEDIEFARSATVFTVHSVEQIPRLESRVLDVVKSIAEEVVVLHFEPVGWQVRGESSSAYAEKHDYNRDLYPTLVAAGVEVIELEVDVIGINPENPTSKIVWK